MSFTKSAMIATAAAALLAACGDNSSPDAPNTGDVSAADAARQVAAQATTQQATLTDAEREQLRQLATGYLDGSAPNLAPGYTTANGIADDVVALQPGQTHNWTVNLQQGVTYRIIGACDNECSNLDLELVDAAGAKVDEDIATDDHPVVDVTPAVAGAYTVRATMKTCTVAPCYTGLRALQRG